MALDLTDDKSTFWLSGGSLGHWTAWNDFKHYSMRPYCDSAKVELWEWIFSVIPHFIMSV